MIIKKILRAILQISLNSIMIAFSAISAFPLIWIIYSSFKTRQEFSLDILSFPKGFEFSNYVEAIKVSHMEIFFKNSLIVSVFTILSVVVIGFVTGYFLSRYDFKFRKTLYAFFIAGMLIPVHGLLIPLFVQLQFLGMLDSRLALILTYTAYNLPLTIFLVEAFVRTIPVEMEEASVIDGSPIYKTLLSIIMPMTTPVLSTSMILTFLNAWNEFPFAMIVMSNKNLYTIPIGMRNFSGEFSTNYTQLLAASVLATLPVIVIYLLVSDKIIQGMTAGAVKA